MTVIPDLPDFCWPVDTTCATDWDAWEVEPDPEADPPVAGIPLYDSSAKARAVALAQQSMRLLTGFRVGGCPITVRPCAAGRRESTWRTYPVPPGGGSTPWQPVSLGGQWLNIGCGCRRSCGCDSTRVVRLYGPVSAVVEVLIDGVVLDPSAYELRPGGVLVRTDGEGWPLSQDMDAPDSEDGTWSVSYIPGLAVDGLGACAAGILAGEYVKALSGDEECRLPTGVTTIARQGVTMTLGTGVFPEGKTGIREIDTYLEAINPHGLRAPSVVWSPDVNRPKPTGVTPGWTPLPDTIDGGTP